MRTYTKYIIGERNGADRYDFGFNRAMQIISQDRTDPLIILEVTVTESHEVTDVIKAMKW